MDLLIRFATAFWQVLAEMSPYLLLGFAVAGVLSVWVSPRLVAHHLGGRGLWPVVKATLLGIPLPLCSCGVIPVAATLRRSGAGRGATTSFLLSTPQTGVDSILATYALLGPVFAVARPIVALVTGIVGGGIVEALDREDAKRTPPTPDTTAPPAHAACCSASTVAPRTVGLQVLGGSTATPAAEPTQPPPSSWLHAAARALHYGFITLPGDLAWRLLAGLAVAAAIMAVAEPGALAPWLGRSWLAMPVMLVIGLPIYTCSAGSIPLALGFIHLGLSPGAALVYLVAGPVTNAATIAVNLTVIGRRATVIYVATAMAGALLAGIALDAMLGALQWTPPGAAAGHAHHDHATGLSLAAHLWAAALLAVIVAAKAARLAPAQTVLRPSRAA
jgi:uncharacterized membrane protein YraQ (UPF0718 family)